jgi:hypothetical protein
VSRYASSAASALIGAGLAAVAFGGGSGFDLGGNTWIELGAVSAGGLLLALAVLRGRRGRLDGGLTLLAFAAFAALCALSILWSVAPERSWLSANLTIAYLALFAGGMAVARLRRDGVTVVLRGVLIAAAAVVVYALITRVFPSLAEDEVFARLGAPYGYWNALGTTAALAVPGALWLGARRTGHQPVNALAYPLLSLLAVAIFLSYSRGALVVAGIGALLWTAFVPLRLRSITLLGVSLAGAAPVIVWALAQDAFTKNQVTQPVREAVATEFGLWLLATVIVMLGAGLTIGFRVARRPPRAPARLRMGAAAGAVAIVVPLVLFAVLVSSDRGLGGTISKGVESLTSVSKATPGGPGRLLSASSSRGQYWHEGKKVFLDHYWKGSGADTFGVTRLRYRGPNDRTVPQHAHGWIHQTAADLGTAGLLLSLVLLVSWLVAAGRATGISLRRRLSFDWTPERVGLVALSLTAFVFGMHSLVDWVWYVPGPTAMALVAAGFVVGQGPLRGRPRRSASEQAPAVAALSGTAEGNNGQSAAGGIHEPAPVPVGAAAFSAPASAAAPLATLPPPSPADAASAPGAASHSNGGAPDEQDTTVLPPLDTLPPPPAEPPPAEPPEPPPAPREPREPRRGVRPALAALTIAVTVLCAWSMWQPLRSDRESDRALDLAADNKTEAARAAAKHAHAIDPLSPRPYVVMNAIEDAAGNRPAALKALVDAVRNFPADPQTWIQLAQYQLNALSKPADALQTIAGALYLDPQSRAAQTVFFQATTATGGVPAPTQAPAPATAPPAATQPTVPTAPAPPAPSQKPGSGGTKAPGG